MKRKKKIESIEFEGNKELNNKKLQESLTSKVNQFVDLEKIQNDLTSLKNLYIEEGFSLAKIIYRLEEKGSKLIFQILENSRVYLTNINITGSQFFLPIDLERRIKSAEIDCFSWITESGKLDEKKIALDLQIIRQEYYKNGFIEMQISKPIIRLIISRDFVTAEVDLKIDEGEQYFVEDIIIQSIDDDLVFSKEKILEKISFKKGSVYNLLQQNQDRIAVNNLYQNSGYAFSNVIVKRSVDKDEKKISLLFEINKKEKVYINRIEFKGNQETKDFIIRRELTIYDGELFNGRKIRESQSKINALGYFSPQAGVSVQRELKEAESEIDYDFYLEEIQTGNLSGGMTYSTVSGFGINFSIAKSNFLGTGRRIALSYDQAENINRGSLSFTEPYLWGSKWRSITSISKDFSGKASSNLDYDKEEQSFSQGFSYPIWKNWTVGLNYSLGEVKKSNFNNDATFDDANSSTRSLTGSLTYSTVNNPFFPSDGVSSRLSFTQTGGFLSGTENLARISYEYRYFENIWSPRTIFYYRLRLRKLFSIEDDLIPTSSRFTLGGSNSIRGFGNYEIRGPSSPSEWEEGFDLDNLQRENPELYEYYLDHRYGSEELLSNIEINFPLAREGQNLRGVFFYDIGNVFAEEKVYEIVGAKKDYSYLRQSYGTGIRIITPLGIMKFDYGIKVNPKKGESSSEFEFTIGSLF